MADEKKTKKISSKNLVLNSQFLNRDTSENPLDRYCI